MYDVYTMKNKTFDQLVEEASIAINEAIMLGGAQELKRVLHAHMENAILWNALQKSNVVIQNDPKDIYHKKQE
jgi:hypothetical protein